MDSAPTTFLEMLSDVQVSVHMAYVSLITSLYNDILWITIFSLARIISLGPGLLYNGLNSELLLQSIRVSSVLSAGDRRARVTS